MPRRSCVTSRRNSVAFRPSPASRQPASLTSCPSIATVVGSDLPQGRSLSSRRKSRRRTSTSSPPATSSAMGMHLHEGRDFTWDDKPEPSTSSSSTGRGTTVTGPEKIPSDASHSVLATASSHVVGVVADVHESGVEDTPARRSSSPSPRGARRCDSSSSALRCRLAALASPRHAHLARAQSKSDRRRSSAQSNRSSITPPRRAVSSCSSSPHSRLSA